MSLYRDGCARRAENEAEDQREDDACEQPSLRRRGGPLKPMAGPLPTAGPVFVATPSSRGAGLWRPPRPSADCTRSKADPPKCTENTAPRVRDWQPLSGEPGRASVRTVWAILWFSALPPVRLDKLGSLFKSNIAHHSITQSVRGDGRRRKHTASRGWWPGTPTRPRRARHSAHPACYAPAR